MAASRWGEALRARLPGIVLLLLTLISALATLPGLRRPDDVGYYEKRFGRLRPLLPAGETVGLLTNLPARNEFLRGREHLLAQYVLAPAIVVRRGDTPLIIVDVYPGPPPLTGADLAGLEPVADLGDGVALFRRAR